MSDQVAVIGIGAMGLVLLKRLRMLGKEVRAYDVSPAAVQKARDAGGQAANSPADAARGVSHIHVIVPKDEHLVDVTLGPDGVLTQASPGTLLLLHSTVMPQTTRRIAEAAAQAKIDVLEATITGIPSRLELGKAQLLVGGPEPLVARSRDYLQKVIGPVNHFGPFGSANIAKLAAAFVSGANRVVLAEALAIVEAGGLDPEKFLNVLREVGAKLPAERWEEIFVIKDGHAWHRPSTNLFRKDVGLAAKLARELGIEAPVAQGVAQTAVRWVKEWDEKGITRDPKTWE
ncbi:MAG TPA: NAD(P)-dependent oxidoreductase [Xanthobacteraceae bacterium]|nr:NAD(P)-dependent oxidoreductase [Xanthobacteraceae bacterium]